MSVRERLLAKVTAGPNGCWQWTGATNGRYGTIKVDGRVRRAMRVSYELFVGPPPEGLDLDHLCRNKLCVNPGHLEPVTRSENNRRAFALTCRRGHARTAINTYHRPDGRTECRECRTVREAA